MADTGKLTGKYGRIRGNHNQIAWYLNGDEPLYNALTDDMSVGIADFAALKFEALRKVGDASSISALRTPTKEQPKPIYLIFEHNEFTMRSGLDEAGRLHPRENYRFLC